MRLRKKAKKLLCQVILEKTGEPHIFDEEECEALLKREAVDWLFILLGAFTYIYLALLAVLFFGKFSSSFPKLFAILDSLQEPYLGALGVYVILKEVRKRRRVYPSRYWGELFIILWMAFGAVATVLVLLSSAYDFDSLYGMILTNMLVVALIYIGGLINKP